jgi:hypothetical protein
MQLASYGVTSTSNVIYAWQNILSATSGGGGFQLSFEFKIGSSALADSIYVFFGTSSLPSAEDSTTCGAGIIVALDVYSAVPKGIYLRKVSSSGTNSKLASYTSFSASGSWETCTITYSAATTNTWKVIAVNWLFISLQPFKYEAIAFHLICLSLPHFSTKFHRLHGRAPRSSRTVIRATLRWLHRPLRGGVSALALALT